MAILNLHLQCVSNGSISEYPNNKRKVSEALRTSEKNGGLLRDAKEVRDNFKMGYACILEKSITG